MRTLYGDPEQVNPQLKRVSRLAVVLGIGWLLAMVLLSIGAHSELSQVATLRFWIANSFAGSGLFSEHDMVDVATIPGKAC